MCFMNCELIVVKIKNVLRFEKYQKKGPQIISNSTVGGKQFYTKVLCNYRVLTKIIIVVIKQSSFLFRLDICFMILAKAVKITAILG